MDVALRRCMAVARLLVSSSLVSLVAAVAAACGGSDLNTGYNTVSDAPDAAGTGGQGAQPVAPQPTASPTSSPQPDPTTTPEPTEPPGGSCTPTFCPSDGFGEPCCVAANGPCGFDLGMGCVSVAGGDPDAG
jgi:hypothetical protein